MCDHTGLECCPSSQKGIGGVKLCILCPAASPVYFVPPLPCSLPCTFMLYIPPLYTRCQIPLLYLTTVVKALTSLDFEGTQSLKEPDYVFPVSPHTHTHTPSHMHTHTHSNCYQTHAHMLNNIFKTQTTCTLR